MALSAKKKAKLALDARRAAVALRSLDGKGYFMDANADHHAARYIETGDESHLNQLPDYRQARAARS